MIEPLSCVIQYLLGQGSLTALVGTRIAPQHRYGGGWDPQQASLVLQWNGGDPDLYLPVQVARLEVRAYGPTHLAASQVWMALVSASRAAGRVPVTVGGQTGLLYALLHSGGPMALWDAEVKLPCLYGFFSASVGESPLT